MEIAFNLHEPEIFAVANSNVSFNRLIYQEDEYLQKEFLAEVFLTKESPVNIDIRCLAWHPSVNHADIIALGQSNGHVSLFSTEIGHGATLPVSRSNSVIGYTPKHSRQCNSLSWNSSIPHLLAIGLEKSRSGSLVIWDVNSKIDFSHYTSDKTKSTSELNPSPNSQSASAKPFIESSQNESVNSLAWITAETLVAGFNKKNLRVYDIRLSASSTSSIIQSKDTCGICVDPTMETRFSCFGDKSISLWDWKNFRKPIISFATPHPISKMEWSSTRSGMLAVLFSPHDGVRLIPDSNKLHIYEMLNAQYTDQHLKVGSLQPILRTVQPKIPDGECEWISGFAWLPFIDDPNLHKNSVLTATNFGSLNITPVQESTSLCWRNRNSFAITRGYDALLLDPLDSVSISDELPDLSKDISHLVHKRVLNGYGLLEEDISKNIELSLEPDNLSLHELWRWIDRIKKALQSKPIVRSHSNLPNSPSHWSKIKSSSKQTVPTKIPLFNGVQFVLKDGQDSGHSSSAETIPWIGVANTKSKVFTGESRNLALMLCDWGNRGNYGRGDGNRFGRNSVGEELVRRVQKSGSTERACAIAVWHLDIKLAIEILNLSLKNKGQSKYSAVAMAMSGYTGSNCPTLWLDTCRQLQSELDNSYLQMTFAFLVASADDSKAASEASGRFDTILQNKNILLQDRLAFACMYLSDSALKNYVNGLADELVKQGSLEGVLVVGLSTKPGIQLLQNYINRTGDVQTPLLAVLQTYNSTFLTEDLQIQHWLECYRNMLNKWKLYFERVDFDILWNKACSLQKPSSQVYLFCHYCNKSITHGQGPRRLFSGGGLPGQGPPITACPSCRKPLPRCSVCSMHLGTRQDETDYKKWITWCMKCRHGGHQAHLKEWFDTHRRCPVTDCKCLCNDDLPPS